MTSIWRFCSTQMHRCTDRHTSILYVIAFAAVVISAQKHTNTHTEIFNTLRTGDADLCFYITTVQDG